MVRKEEMSYTAPEKKETSYGICVGMVEWYGMDVLGCSNNSRIERKLLGYGGGR